MVNRRLVLDVIDQVQLAWLQTGGFNRSGKWYEYKAQDIAQTQERRFVGDVAIHRARDAVLCKMDKIVMSAGTSARNDKTEMKSDLNVFFGQLSRKKPLLQYDKQWRWSKQLVNTFDAEPCPGHVWCPIIKRLGSYEERKCVLCMYLPLDLLHYCKFTPQAKSYLLLTAEVVPRMISYKTMRHLFGGDGHGLKWSMSNGLIMHYTFAESFERLDFCLIPHEKQGKPDELKLVLINECIRHESVYAGNTWDEYDGTFLEFREECESRPERRFLFFHYWMCLLKSRRDFTPGWEKLEKKVVDGGLWLIPGRYLSSRSRLSLLSGGNRLTGEGPYIRKSMADKMGIQVGDELQPQQKEIDRYTFEGSKTSNDGNEEDNSVKDIFRVPASTYRPEGYSDDDKDDI